ncbi:MAG: hypothetical protein ACF8PN_00315 [Phycisphaerales bacterium]
MTTSFSCESSRSSPNPAAIGRSEQSAALEVAPEAVLAFPGEPLVFPVTRSPSTSDAPVTARVQTPGGELGVASVRWIRVERDDLWPAQRDAAPFSLPWTERPVSYREFGEDAPADANGIGLVEPNEVSLGGGSIEVEGMEIEVRLFARPSSDLGSGVDWICGSTRRWPDPEAPLEAFRRRLLMNHGMGDATPEFAPTPLLGTLARHNALRWSLGLEGLRSASDGAADAIEEALTRRCRDGAVEFAAWVVDPSSLSQLEAILVGRRPGEASVAKAQAALAWLDDQENVVVSVDSDAGARVSLGVTNLSHRPATYSIEWIGADQPAVPLEVSPFRHSRVELDRPRDRRAAELRVTGAGGSSRATVGPPALTVRPPGMTISRFVEAWRLETWMKRTPRLAPEEVATRVVIRREGEHWIVRAEARRASGMNPPTNDDDAVNTARGPADLVGVESVIFFVGPYRDPDLVIAVTPDGRVREWTGSSLQSPVKTRGDETLWTAEVTLPKEVVGEAVEIGCIRTVAGSRMAWMTPYPALPWRLDPGRVRFDLTAWEALPGHAPTESAPTGD